MPINNFKHRLLVAVPTLRGEFFSKAVIYIYEHSEKEGAVGFTINKPLSATIDNVMDHLKIDVTDEKIIDLPVFSGGPVGPDQGFVIHDRMSVAQHKDDKEVSISTSRDMLRDIAEGKGPDHFMITLGYAGWSPGQLEAEVLRNDWLIAPFEKKVLFDTPIAKRWTVAGRLLGIDINTLSDQIGHA